MPIIYLKKVNEAVKAFDLLDAAQVSFNEAFGELNPPEQKEFERISGATISKKENTEDLKAKIDNVNKILDAHCGNTQDREACSRFQNGECSLKKPKSCTILQIRNAIHIQSSKDQKEK